MKSGTPCRPWWSQCSPRCPNSLSQILSGYSKPKGDGYRAICFLQNGTVRFVSRNRRNLTARFPSLQDIAKSIRAVSAVFDGEIVALDQSGMPSFEGLRTRTSECAIVYYAFDLLYFDGHDFTKAPLISRKAALKKILPRRNTGRVRYTDHIVGEGERLFQELEKKQLEGMLDRYVEWLRDPNKPPDVRVMRPCVLCTITHTLAQFFEPSRRLVGNGRQLTIKLSAN
jgi:ATP-dependent DNA ligase